MAEKTADLYCPACGQRPIFKRARYAFDCPTCRRHYLIRLNERALAEGT